MKQIFKTIYNFLFFLYVIVVIFNLASFFINKIQIKSIISPSSFNTDNNKITHVNFNDVIGLNDVKDEFNYYVDLIKNKEIYNKFNVKLPKGILLVGPPGTGKTLLVKAIATEFDIDLIQTSGSEFVEMYVGVGAARIRKLFSKAREKKNCIIFIFNIFNLRHCQILFCYYCFFVKSHICC